VPDNRCRLDLNARSAIRKESVAGTTAIRDGIRQTLPMGMLNTVEPKH